jgi:hypothetical protein
LTTGERHPAYPSFSVGAAPARVALLLLRELQIADLKLQIRVCLYTCRASPPMAKKIT